MLPMLTMVYMCAFKLTEISLVPIYHDQAYHNRKLLTYARGLLNGSNVISSRKLHMLVVYTCVTVARVRISISAV